jgi:hypothetical protein
VKFTIDDKAPPPSDNVRALKAIATLDALKDGELLTSRSLSVKSKVRWHSLRNVMCEIPPDYSVRDGFRKLYGNKRTIKAWRDSQIQG